MTVTSLLSGAKKYSMKSENGKNIKTHLPYETDPWHMNYRINIYLSTKVKKSGVSCNNELHQKCLFRYFLKYLQIQNSYIYIYI